MSDFTPETIEIQLTRGYVATVDIDDADLLAFNWYAVFSKRHNIVYAGRQITISAGRQRREMLHRAILSRILGRPLDRGELCDHENGNGLDCTRGNLRLATYGLNGANRKLNANSSSGYKGVTFHKKTGKWAAQIFIDGKREHLGLYVLPELAYEAYCNRAVEAWGRYARLK